MANLIESSGFSYTVKTVPEWFYQALKHPVTMEKGYVRVLPNVTKDARIKKLIMTENSISQVDNRDCDWSPQQRFELDEAEITVKNFKINHEQCLEELDSLYSEELFNSIGATKDKWPQAPEFEDAIMFHIQNALSQDIERLVWGGASNAVDGIHDGLYDKAAASSDTIKVANTVTIDSTNVLTEVQRVWESIPDRVLQDEAFDPVRAQVRIFVSSDIMRYLKQALSTVPTSYQVQLPAFTIDGGVIRYLGVEIVSVGLPANTMMAFSKDDAYFATDLLSDTTEIRVAMGKELMNESKVYIKGAYRADAGFIFDDEVVLYSL